MYNTDFPTRAELPGAAQLLRSTIIAALVAAGLLVTTILPAEYGIDPTGIGRVLGLTRMGEIKTSLAREAGAEKPSPATAASEKPPAIQAPADVAAPEMTKPAQPDVKQAAPAQHTMTVRLKPVQAAEIKLAMRKGASVRYEWSSEGGGVNFDTHGDPVGATKDFYHGYGKGRNKNADSGVLEAAFDGTHGWFWRNRSNAEVTVTAENQRRLREHQTCALIAGDDSFPGQPHAKGSNAVFAVNRGYARVPHIVNWLHHTLRFKSQLVRLLLIVFVTNIMVAGTGFASPANWLEHEKSHFSVVQQPVDSGHADDHADSSPEQPAGQKLVKHECHASHYFQTIVAAGPIMLPPAPAVVPVIFYQAPVLRDTAESLFRPPR